MKEIEMPEVGAVDVDALSETTVTYRTMSVSPQCDATGEIDEEEPGRHNDTVASVDESRRVLLFPCGVGNLDPIESVSRVALDPRPSLL
jgi:hypothetical protein